MQPPAWLWALCPWVPRDKMPCKHLGFPSTNNSERHSRPPLIMLILVCYCVQTLGVTDGRLQEIGLLDRGHTKTLSLSRTGPRVP